MGKGETQLTVRKRSNGLDFSPQRLPNTTSSALSASSSYNTHSSHFKLKSPKSRKHQDALFEIPEQGQTTNRGQSQAISQFKTPGPPIVRSLIKEGRAPVHRTGTMQFIKDKRLKKRGSNASICTTQSTASSMWAPKPSLVALPTEVLDNILEYLEQTDLHSVMLTSTALVEAAANRIYYHPKFATTYRYAQFAYTVSHKQTYADRVRVLDVSGFNKVPQFEREPEAGWREWKLRNHDMYRANSKLVVPPKKPSARKRVTRRSHPKCNPFLEPWALSRDIPLGALCHALKSCENLHTVNISKVQLAEDFEINDKMYPPSTWTGSIYVSDVPKSWTWNSDGIKSINNTIIIDHLVKLEHLETVIANNSIFLSTKMIRNLVDGSADRLKYLDFKDSGLEREKPWAIKGTGEEVKKVIREMEKNGLIPISAVDA